MSRKFTDSEIRAYSKNRHEEKILRKRLHKLKEDIGSFHDVSAKLKQNLVAESKEIRMTSGGSPVPPGFEFESDFDISKRVSRPWAYSVMETTYNAAYRDAVIPLPKSKNRPKSEASRSVSTLSTSLPNRAMSSKSRLSSLKSQSFVDFSSDTNNQSQDLSNNALSPDFNGLRGWKRAHTDINIMVDKTHAEDSVCLDTEKVIHKAMSANNLNSNHMNITTDSETTTIDTNDNCDTKLNVYKQEHHKNQGTDSDGTETMCVIETVHAIDRHEETAQTNSYKPLKEFKQSTKVITLPPMYKIDSKAYQEAERERLITRSKSRVSFSGLPTGVAPELQTDRPPRRSPPVVEKKPMTSEVKESENVMQSTESPDVLRESIDSISRTDGRYFPRSTTLFTLDPETMHDVRVRQIDDVEYRGRKLRNYIRPEDRYKLDPLVMKMRQNKMDKLAKESMSLLKRVNHENIKVDIAFPRTERKRILTKLVRANNLTSGRKVYDNNGPVIQKRVATFMESISDYIQQQQIEREQCYT
ncbi:hypothetical protein ACF0H5_007194 [Mactra antiquata]